MSAGVGLLHIPLLVQYTVNSYDPAGTQQVFTKQIKFSNQNKINVFYSTAENQPVYINCPAWHAKVDWNVSKT